MELAKYIGMDVHQSTVVVNVRDQWGKVILESTVPTEAGAILQCIGGLKGQLQVTFEEGTHAQWLYELLNHRVAKVVVCDPRQNRLVQSGSKSDGIDAGKLSELLRLNGLSAVYHGEGGTGTLKELVKSYRSLVQDSVRVMNRTKAIYRGRAIATAGQAIYEPKEKDRFLRQLSNPGARTRAELLYEELEVLQQLRPKAERAMVKEARRHPAYRLLRSIPQLGPIRVAQLLAVVQTPFRFPSRSAFWKYCGLAVVTSGSGECLYVKGQLVRSKKPVATRGLNKDHNPQMKELFKSVAVRARCRSPFKPYYEAWVAGGMKPEIATVALARKIAAITRSVWKKGVPFDPKKMKTT
jgi:transposase